MRAAFRFLFILDQASELEAITRQLEQSGFHFTSEQVQNDEQLREALRRQRWELILAEEVSALPLATALTTARELAAETPLLVVGDSRGEEIAIGWMRAGARDIIFKKNLASLGPAVTRELAEAEKRERSKQIVAKTDENEQNYRRMIESVRDYAIILMDAEGKITSWNPGARRIFGYSESEAIGRSGSILMLEDDQKQGAFKRELAKAQSDGSAEDERWALRKNGTRFWGSGVLTALFSDDSTLRGFVRILKDNTNRKLAMEQVEEARKRAETASKAKTQFLANMSHEIRTPLGIMLGFAELLSDPSHTVQEKENFAQTILKNGQTLSRLINDVLDVSKVEANKLETEKVDFSLSEFLSDVLAMMRLQAEEKGLELIVTTEGPVPRRVFSDPTRLRQILANMIGNSLKFTDAGMVELRVRSVSSPQTHSSMILEFEVKDTGQGIPAENVSSLFQPFTQGDGPNARKLGGSGLGLYLSKRLAQALGGDLVLRETSENRGSTFVFTIDAGPFETDVTFYTERSAPSAKEQGLTGVHVLVVDDSPDNRLLVRRVLEQVHAEVETADNGLAAVEMAKEKSFDLILMDIQMPVMDGYEAFKQLRQNGFTDPIVALTAHALHSEREQCFSLGFDDHLSKPIDRKLLVETISRLTQKEHHSRPHLIQLRP